MAGTLYSFTEKTNKISGVHNDNLRTYWKIVWKLKAALASASKHIFGSNYVFSIPAQVPAIFLLVNSAEVYNFYWVFVVQCSVVPFAIHFFTKFLNMLREINIWIPTLGRGYGKSLEMMDDVRLQFKVKFSHNTKRKKMRRLWHWIEDNLVYDER